MVVPTDSIAAAAPSAEFDRLERLRATRVMRGDGFPMWTRAAIGVVGAGALGSRLVPDIVRSGGSATVYDFDVATVGNEGNQLVKRGRLKVESLIEHCAEIVPGKVIGHAIDIRHAGVGQLMKLSAICDCSDDPLLAWLLGLISTGTGVPLLRLAVDGSGTRNYGRVLCSHGGMGRACVVCSMTTDQIFGNRRRIPCPGAGAVATEAPPTITGAPMAAGCAAAGLLQLQRLVTRNDLDLVLDREVLLDWDHMVTASMQLRRSRSCLSAHDRWELVRLGRSAEQTSWGDLFATVGAGNGAAVSLEPYLHPLNTAAVCACRRTAAAIGTRWIVPPPCAHCGGAMNWLTESQLRRISYSTAGELGILDSPLCDFGLPESGASFVVRRDGRHRFHLVLN